MPVYTDVFGGSLVYPSDISYRTISFFEDVRLNWPEETSAVDDPLARIMDCTATNPGTALRLPDATKGSNGFTILFNNIDAESFEVQTYDGTLLCTVADGEAWQVYLTSNSLEDGPWRAFQYASYVSTANAGALAGSGLKAVIATLAVDAAITLFNTAYSAGNADRAKVFVWNGTSDTLTLPDPGTVGNGWFIDLSNAGTGSVTANPAGAVTIDGSATKVYDPGESSRIISDGTAYYTVGFGQSAVFVFDNVSISIAGSGNYTLTGSELNRISYNLTGVLTGNRSVIVPATVQQYWITNSTTGAFTVTIKVSGMTGVTVGQGESAILYCNGVDVQVADSGGVSLPIAVSQGGTGATTAGNALINLGGTATGIGVFTAANQAAAWTALGVAPSGVVDGGTF